MKVKVGNHDLTCVEWGALLGRGVREITKDPNGNIELDFATDEPLTSVQWEKIIKKINSPFKTDAVGEVEWVLKQAKAKETFAALAIANQNTAPWGKALYALGVALGLVE